MIYKNELRRMKEARIKNAINYTCLIAISLIVVSIAIKTTIEDASLSLQVICLTVCAGVISGLLGLIYRQKIFKKKFLSYEVQLNENCCAVKSDKGEYKIELKRIKSFTVLKDGSMVLRNNLLKMEKLSPYIEKKEEIAEFLIDKGLNNNPNDITYYLQFFSLITYVALMLQRLFNSYIYYLIVGSLFVLSGIYTIVQIVLYGRKRVLQLPIIIFWSYLTYIVAKNIIKIIFLLQT
ncbi:hypothetical protein [Marispirochaeta aestuarii]|uniref:hypothetical protein n=1 Tax=Marispirochaeta aestuarii TaxID=1963862 RepID=UPI0029C737A2|nr:hypothetical protein [Marispirochaeta aestuarii]